MVTRRAPDAARRSTARGARRASARDGRLSRLVGDPMSAPSSPSSAALSRRRKLLAASRKRHPPRAPRVEPPTGPAAGYALALARLLKPLDEALSSALSGAGIDVRVTPRRDGAGEAVETRLDAQGDAPAITVPKGVRDLVVSTLKRIVRALLTSSGLDTILLRAAEGADRHSRAAWKKQAEALGLSPEGEDLFLARRMRGFRAGNLKLIKSLCAEHVTRVGKVLTAAGRGTRVEEIARELQEATGATKARAQLLARDQVLKMNSQVTQDRHRAAGIEEYVWSASRDVRVRKSHKDLDGTRQRYDDPPIVDERTGRRAHAGEDYQCRCICLPVLPD